MEVTGLPDYQATFSFINRYALPLLRRRAIEPIRLRPDSINQADAGMGTVVLLVIVDR